MRYVCPDIVVGYERTLYSTPEGDLTVLICVIIFEPSSGGGAPRPFNLTYSTEDYTAGKRDTMLYSCSIHCIVTKFRLLKFMQLTH